MNHSPLIRGAFWLTAISFLTRVMGFFFRIFLSRTFGEESVGLYQLIFPVYSLCLAFSVAGIQTALSRIVAYKTEQQDISGAKHSLYTALIFSLFLSLISLLVVQHHAAFISDVLIQEARCRNLLIIMTYAFPFACIHSCISGYYFGLKKTAVPAISQLLEQIFRIGSVYLLTTLAQHKNLPIHIAFAVIGIVIGEIASSLCTIISLYTSQKIHIFRKHRCVLLSNFFRNLKELTSLSVPLSGNRMFLTLLQSIEAVSIPMQLQIYHYSVKESLSIYGVLTGMALPCILFPSAITNSFSLLLTPTVAEMDSASDYEHLSDIIKKTIFLCFSLGLIACFFFLIFGNLIGNLLFHSQLAGQFLLTLAWICPFLYLNTALASIINGLGKTRVTFTVHFAGITIRILSIFYLIPRFDLKGYLWGLLISQLIVSTSFCLFLINETNNNFYYPRIHKEFQSDTNDKKYTRKQ